MRKTFLNAVLFSAAFATAAGTLVSCKDYDDDIQSLQEQINAKATATELTSQLATMSSNLSATKSDLETQISNLKTQVANAEKEASEAAATALKTVEAKLATVEEAQKKVAALSDEIKKANEAQMAELTKKVQAMAADIEGVVGKRLSSLVFAPTTYVDGIETIKFASLEYTDWGTEAANWLADAAKAGNKQNVIDNATTEAVYYVSPSTINESLIEKLEFLANKATNLHTRAAGDEAPIKVVGKPEIKDGKMTLKLAKNTTSKFNFKRANTWTWVWNEETKTYDYKTNKIGQIEGQYSTVWGWSTSTDANGNVTHTENYNPGLYGNQEDEFVVVSLKATNKLNDAEVKAGVNPDVFSDWTRLAETTVRPYIHNKKAVKWDKKSELAEVNGGIYNPNYTPNDTVSHFWNYTQIYGTVLDPVTNTYVPAPVTTELPSYRNYYNIAFDAKYDEPFDLSKVVTVCDDMGNEIDAASYGMAFEFHVMDYKLKNENDTKDATNQIHFAKLDGSILTSTARNGVANNRDAIGRMPLIQVVLKDTKNNGVVDVRYFKIHWVADTAVKTYNDLEPLNKHKYACGVVQKDTIFEKEVNGMAAFVNLSKDEFKNNYQLNTKYDQTTDTWGYWLYDTAEKAAAGKDNTWNTKLGEFKILNEQWQQGQTMNYEWTLNTTNHKATQAEYEAGKKVITAYARFESQAYGVLVVKVVKELAIDKIAYATGLNYAQEQWDPAGVTMANALTNADKVTFVNPSLRSDAQFGTAAGFTDAQLVRSILMSYINNGQTPNSVVALLNGAESVHKLIFDKDRLAEVATATATTAADWTLSADATTLYYKTVTAATIDQTNGNIQLYEGATPGKAGVPTEGALLLVGKKVPVIVGGDGCDYAQVVDKYFVQFMTPLKISGIDVTDQLKDIIDGADSSVDLTDKLLVKEAFGLERTIVGPAASLDANAAALCAWYIVGAPDYTGDIMTNLNKDGGIDTECKTKLSDLKKMDGVTPKYTVWVDNTTDPTGKLKAYFHNASGAAIAQPFKVQIPVKVTTKWGVMKAFVTLDIVKGNYGL